MADKQTPLMEQYSAIKKQNPDCLLLFRLGDFYELFFEDAVKTASELGIVLTQRNGVPMCGIPWHAHEMYLTKLVKNGHRVAICDQVETPEEARLRGWKGPIERKVVRIVTSGTIVEQSMLLEKSHNFLMAISNMLDNKLGVAYADVSTGSFFVEEINCEDLLLTISKISPTEVVCPDSLLSKKDFLESVDKFKSIIIALPNSKFTGNSPSSKLAAFFKVNFIDSFGNFSKCELEAAAEIVEYISDVYSANNVGLSIPKLIHYGDYMVLDHFTRKSLELDKTQNGCKKGSLLHDIDNTLTSQGGRLLERWLMQPLVNTQEIEKRLDFVEFFVNETLVLQEIRNVLKNFPDVERALSRVLLQKAGPRDLRYVAIAIEKFLDLDRVLSKLEKLEKLTLSADSLITLKDLLNTSLIAEPPVLTRDGGFIKKGYDRELDELVDLMDNGEYVIQKLQKTYVEETGIQTLKIKHNGTIGYFIEVSPNHISKIPYSFIHRQSLGSCIRYTTRELTDIAGKIYSAESSAKRREMEIFEELIAQIAFFAETIRYISDNASFIDVVTSFSYLAINNHYSRPIISNDKTFYVKNGRHPVVENRLLSNGVKFISNDCEMADDCELLILTGPNMGGKSTYLRQNAIIAIMAQIGSFVPADIAKIGVIDRIFSRVGSSDDISSGKSTFMVEMLETATILRQSTEKSFVILDEVGRGTSTYDGLAIAWAVIEEIATNIKARAIFATHYHELIKIKECLENVRFLTVKVTTWEDQVIFLHKVEEGFASKSYGLNVAALAGFPKKVILRANEVLNVWYNKLEYMDS
jgi:DNA mismatch repair protein MutS